MTVEQEIAHALSRLAEAINNLGQIIPAMPGYDVLTVSDADEFDFSGEPVIAWRIRGAGPPYPITAADGEAGTRCAVLCPDERVIERGFCVYESLENWVEVERTKWEAKRANRR